MARRRPHAQDLGGIANALAVTAQELEDADEHGAAEQLHNLHDQLRELEALWREDETLLDLVKSGVAPKRQEHKLLRCGSGVGNPDCSEDEMPKALDELSGDGWSILSDYYDSMAKPPWRILLRREVVK